MNFLSSKLKNLIKSLLGKPTLDEKSVEETLKEIRKILIASDVPIDLTNQLIENIRKKVLKEKIPSGLTLREHLIKTIYDELVSLLGKEFSPLNEKRIMLVGLFGSGKTTTASKIAYYLKKKGKKVALVCLDYHRPAAPEQLKQLAEKIHVKYYIDPNNDPYNAAKKSLELFSKYDSIIFDTAGRNSLDEELANELKKLAEIIKPTEVLLVIPADIGKVAKEQAEGFHKLAKITGIIITKFDGTAKGGGALAACSTTKAKVKFLGIGEKIEDLEQYNPKRFVSRLLGFGDLETLLEKAKEAEIKKETAEKIIEGKFTLNDFMEQIEGISKLGPLTKIAQMLPGLSLSLPEDILKIQEKKMKKWKVIIQSMTKEERENPEIINQSRIRRIAKGSGTKEEEVRELLATYKKLKKFSKMFKGIREKDFSSLQKILKRFGFKFGF
ncbi:MAG: signal recognition particle protein [Candidatus Aenigmarchaeota archaeon ex4484_224]|nr:MAG: signal recognition particle protein [Candidatus Aenigmarchaeota archaeon ex4484_224]